MGRVWKREKAVGDGLRGRGEGLTAREGCGKSYQDWSEVDQHDSCTVSDVRTSDGDEFT